jgi:hypothetical protein
MSQGLRTMIEIVNDHIAAQAALAGNAEAMLREAHKAEIRMTKRFESDPSLATFTAHYADALVNVLKVVPPELHAIVIRNLIAQVVAEWEDCAIEFNAQIGNDGP